MLRAPGPETSVDGDQVRILVPFVATQVTAQVMDRMPHLGVIGTGFGAPAALVREEWPPSGAVRLMS